MKVLKIGKNAGCTQFYYEIGFDCDGWFNGVKCISIIPRVNDTILEVAREYNADVKEVSVRKIRTNNSKVIWKKSGADFLKQ